MSGIKKLEELLPYSQTLNILFVEDNEEVRSQVFKLLSNIFKNIDVAKDGQEAIETYKSFQEEHNKHYDIVITDLRMPHMDGIELSKEIISIKENQIILIVSAYTYPDQLLELINLGITTFIQKPIEQKNLLKSLVQAINLCQTGNTKFNNQ